MVERFETRKLVDRAKGLNEKMGLSEPEAFRWIQKASMDRRLTMADVAKAIIERSPRRRRLDPGSARGGVRQPLCDCRAQHSGDGAIPIRFVMRIVEQRRP